MPGVSTTVRVSKDGQYILATGIYKPRVKCFDVNNLSLKFERCFDSEAVTFEILSDDYSKVSVSALHIIYILCTILFVVGIFTMRPLHRIPRSVRKVLSFAHTQIWQRHEIPLS